MPVHNATNGMGAQTPTEKYGVRSPFHAGGGGGGGGGWQRCCDAGVGRRVEEGPLPAFDRVSHRWRNHCDECKRR